METWKTYVYIYKVPVQVHINDDPQGSLRCDVNLSINPIDSPPGSGTRCEIKNLNSIKFMTAAMSTSNNYFLSSTQLQRQIWAYEIHRQSTLLVNSPGARIEQETRGFDEITFQTFRLRSKEEAPDYRYMPDPNLGVLRLSEVVVSALRMCLAQGWIPRNASTRSAQPFLSSHGRHVHDSNTYMLSPTEMSMCYWESTADVKYNMTVKIPEKDALSSILTKSWMALEIQTERKGTQRGWPTGTSCPLFGPWEFGSSQHQGDTRTLGPARLAEKDIPAKHDIRFPVGWAYRYGSV